MSQNLSRSLRFVKQPVRGSGVVAAQNQRAADIGARVLAEGGNAVDAAVATAFSLAVLEPWMSGLGGGGYMMVYDAARRRAHCVDFGMIAARRLDPAFYPLAEGKGGDLFGWPSVLEDRNILGYPSIAVPGQPEGMRLALETFGTRSWAQSLAPAIEQAEQGLDVDWYASIVLASAAPILTRFPASKAVFLPDDFVPVAEWGGATPRIRNPALLATLKRLRDAGARDYYDGELARSLAADLARGGSAIAADDLSRYHARLLPPLSMLHGGAELLLPPALTAGPTLADALSIAAPHLQQGLNARAFVAYAEALDAAYEKRLNTMGETENQGGCTTNLCVIDKQGNMVALTQTLLSLFGSRVVLPQSGVLMNNGIMWFDPRPGRPNSMAPGKRPLSNMLPSLGLKDGKPWLAIGASGGRRILPAVMQLVSFLTDHGMGLEQAFHQPRIDVSVTGQPAYSPLLDDATIAALCQRFPKATARPLYPYPLAYACPSAVAIEPDGTRIGMTEIGQPWAGAAGSA
ncbi:gamma-glutamyltransferase family protein [Ferrovibrio sp.]|uniref:gamma-glutamyltransferase family protein n=1 Tax=Ferrovibrio sp. TaxID=1917215 RepID=UPI0025C56465|nr:gamma-glutamyltransferase [Ferrovibrio sp.]MBX3456265.1 gamma-glutamyltransferase [Ferrovibrio sp.]